ncbi:MAG: hypothetical protein WAV20_14535 [Blastocatellia bacterium]
MNLIPRLMFGCTAILVVAITAAGQERRTDPVGDLTGRDAVGFRKDSVTKETLGERRAPANTPTTKQAIEDFMQLQKSNRRIQDISRLQPPPLEAILVAAKDVSTRATRLKTSLALPSPPKESKTGITPATSIDELMNRIKELDANIKLFVTNPIFRQMTESGRDLPMEASVSLSKVIALSKVLEESAGKLR